MPLATFDQLIKLAQNGATVAFVNRMPEDVPGLSNVDNKRNTFKKLLAQLRFEDAGKPGVQRASAGKGAFLLGKDINQLLTAADVKREAMVDNGLQYIRRRHDKGYYYFIVNWSDKAVDGWVPLQTSAKSVALYNPMTEKLGMAQFRLTNGRASDGRTTNGTGEVYLQLAPGESCILETNGTAVSGPAYAYLKPAGQPQEIKGTWNIKFVSGGPELPKPMKTDKLGSWTKEAGDDVKKFSGTADYTISFPKPTGTGDGWLLDLGQVAESARVLLNGKLLGTLIGPVYQLFIPRDQLKESNTLTISVSNSMANRITDLDKNKVDWKKFYNINMSARLKENRDENGNFTAERWSPKESGLLGPVTLTPVRSLAGSGMSVKGE